MIHLYMAELVQLGNGTPDHRSRLLNVPPERVEYPNAEGCDFGSWAQNCVLFLKCPPCVFRAVVFCVDCESKLGDIFDRGDDDLRIEEWIHRLSQEAEGTNGAIYSIMGNHEVSHPGQ